MLHATLEPRQKGDNWCIPSDKNREQIGKLWLKFRPQRRTRHVRWVVPIQLPMWTFFQALCSGERQINLDPQRNVCCLQLESTARPSKPTLKNRIKHWNDLQIKTETLIYIHLLKLYLYPSYCALVVLDIVLGLSKIKVMHAWNNIKNIGFSTWAVMFWIHTTASNVSCCSEGETPLPAKI